MNKFLTTFALVALAVTSARTAAYEITLFPASSVYDSDPAVMDGKLGLPQQNLMVEVFEDEQLLPQIKANVVGHRNDDDASPSSAWDGQWPSSAGQDETDFFIGVPGVRLFGIGVGNNGPDGPEEVAINSDKPIALKSLAGHTIEAQGRAYYLRIRAEDNDPGIHRVHFSHAAKLRFDHLVLQRTNQAEGPLLAEAPRLSPPVATNAPPLMVVPHLSTAAEREVNPVPRHPSPLPSREAWKRGLLLLSKAGAKYVGDQVRFFAVDPDGVLTAVKPQWLSLHGTEGKPFRLHGEVWLGGRYEQMLFPEDLPDGFALFVREWDSVQRYSFTSRGAEVKRRIIHGRPTHQIMTVEQFAAPPEGSWIPFYVDANWDRILFVFGSEVAELNGPLDVDGANKIAIAPGTRLRELRLELFENP